MELPQVDFSTALEQLQIYMWAYLQSQIEIQLVPTVGKISDFIVQDERAVDVDDVLAKLRKLTESDNFGNYADPYWSRVLAQTAKFERSENLESLLMQTKAWFGLLFSGMENKAVNKGAK